MIPENYYNHGQSAIWTNESIPEMILNKHNTAKGVYGKIVIISGELEYTIYNNDDSVKSVSKISPGKDGIALPQQWHKIKPLGKVKMLVEFFKKKPEHISKVELQFKEDFEMSPHREVFELLEKIENKSDKKALDVGCGGGRNSLLMAQSGLNVLSLDQNQEALYLLGSIAETNNLNLSTQKVDLNDYVVSGEYDCIISTVVLQFLEYSSSLEIISSMQESTIIGGYNLIIAPVDSTDHLCPIRFSTVFKEGEIKKLYEKWEIKEYNEMIGRFHRLDEKGNKIISKFVTILAKKIV